jgi:hypothetical protein
MNESLQELLDEFSPEVRRLVLSVRERIRELVPEAQEKVMKGHKAISYNFGSGMKDQFAALVLHRAHVNLQFPQGTLLPDPAGLLEGTGKSMRHVKIREEATVRREEVRRLVEAAAARAQT